MKYDSIFALAEEEKELFSSRVIDNELCVAMLLFHQNLLGRTTIYFSLRVQSDLVYDISGSGQVLWTNEIDLIDIFIKRKTNLDQYSQFESQRSNHDVDDMVEN